MFPDFYIRLLKRKIPAWSNERGRKLLEQCVHIKNNPPAFDTNYATPPDLTPAPLDNELYGQFIDAWQPRPYEGVEEMLVILRSLVTHEDEE